MSATFILTGEAAQSPAAAGGKGAALARLASKFPVPAFVVVSADALDDGGLKADARTQLTAAIGSLGAGPFAVRSSGREEDGADSAHAGQFETELNVAAKDVPAAAHRVWKSGFSETLAQYRAAKGLSGAPQPPAVVVQVMVKARAAGVAFSADPVSGDRGVVVVSAIRGLADKLVCGEADGDSYRIGADGRTLDAEIIGDEPVLSEAERAEVAAMARRSEQHFGRPQDIEWAFDERGLHMLQSRPITTLGSVERAAGDPSPLCGGAGVGGGSGGVVLDANQGLTRGEAPHPNPSPQGGGGRVAAAAGHAATPDDIVIWDNSNIVESYPGVTSPLTYSFARYVYSHVYQAFSRLMGVSAAKVEEQRSVFENMLGRVDGRVYYNLLNWYRALALFPGFKANRKFMEGMMGVSEALPQEMADAIAPPTDDAVERFLDNLNLVRVGGGLIWHEITIRSTIDRFYERLNVALAIPDAQIDGMSATQLVAEYRNLEQQLLAKWDAPLVNDFLCMIAFGAAQKAMTSWAGDDGLALLSNMLIGQGDIVSAEPARMIREMGAMVRDRPDVVKRLAVGERAAVDAMPDLRRAFDAYIAKFGDRCTQELKLESRTLHDDPGQVLMAVAAAAKKALAEKALKETVGDPSPLWGGEGVGGGSAGKSADHVQVSKRGEAPHPLPPPHKGRGGERSIIVDVDQLPIDGALKLLIARWLLKWAKARVRDRENLRFERTRLFGRVRRIFLAMGARLVEAGVLASQRDVFNLTVEELMGAVEGSGITSDLKTLAALREAEHRQQLSRPDPPERFTVRGAHIVGVAGLTAQSSVVAEGGETRKGLACCKGVVTARVRVIEDPRVEALLPGEILVARHTDPGWIAVFANAAGVIAERGSLLSHSAIVAREMGVPCVVSLKGVTQWLKTGDIVRLDGGAGTVERTGRDG